MSATYRIYGQILQTDFTFKTHLLPASGTPDVTFSLVDSPPDYQEWHHIKPVMDVNDSVLVYSCETYDVFHFVDLADFYVFRDKIICHLIDPAYDYQVEVILLGLVFAYWLEKRGIRALHAAAVNINGEGVAFLSTNAGGKSSLAATLTQMGHALITDDILPIQMLDDRFMVHPSFPQTRMWPEVAQHFVGSFEDLELAHPNYVKRRVPVSKLGGFCEESVPLARIYLPERRKTSDVTIKLEPVSPVEALMDLTAYSFAVHYVEAMGLQLERFQFFSVLAQAVPIYKLIYPDGLHLLPEVCRQISDELATSKL